MLVFGMATTPNTWFFDPLVFERGLLNTIPEINDHFKNIYQDDENFAMDVEFKITKTKDGSRGDLAIKQVCRRAN